MKAKQHKHDYELQYRETGGYTNVVFFVFICRTCTSIHVERVVLQ